ncbi:MAG TPA: hypothetical protein VGC06_14360, partial [Actinomycetes bacterium]
MRTDRHLDPIPTTAAPPGRWRLANQLAVAPGEIAPRRRRWRGGWTAALLLALAPVVVVVAEGRPELVPALLLPPVVVWLAARRTLEA